MYAEKKLKPRLSPDRKHMLLFFKNPENMKTYLMENEVVIDERQKAKLWEHFDILFGKMSADHIAHIEVMYDNGYEKHQVISDCDMPKDLQLN